MSENCARLTSQPNQDTIAGRTVVQVPATFAKFLRRVQHLTPGRHQITLTIGERGEPADWSVMPLGKVER